MPYLNTEVVTLITSDNCFFRQDSVKQYCKIQHYWVGDKNKEISEISSIYPYFLIILIFT